MMATDNEMALSLISAEWRPSKTVGTREKAAYVKALGWNASSMSDAELARQAKAVTDLMSDLDMPDGDSYLKDTLTVLRAEESRRARKNPTKAEHRKSGSDDLERAYSYRRRFDKDGRINDGLNAYRWFVMAHEELKYAGKPRGALDDARAELDHLRPRLLRMMK